MNVLYEFNYFEGVEYFHLYDSFRGREMEPDKSCGHKSVIPLGAFNIKLLSALHIQFNTIMTYVHLLFDLDYPDLTLIDKLIWFGSDSIWLNEVLKKHFLRQDNLTFIRVEQALT